MGKIMNATKKFKLYIHIYTYVYSYSYKLVDIESTYMHI